ncbi:hypothetical protein BKA56DRAFT_621234 [Ilyonectria sp. MPI-CAGE-AT-0026]|nr:hypothetical protein BKA56DRAFT_621234 [Ilyonectria sp. MPI-CAGE-AT-0026]
MFGVRLSTLDFNTRLGMKPDCDDVFTVIGYTTRTAYLLISTYSRILAAYLADFIPAQSTSPRLSRTSIPAINNLGDMHILSQMQCSQLLSAEAPPPKLASLGTRPAPTEAASGTVASKILNQGKNNPDLSLLYFFYCWWLKESFRINVVGPVRCEAPAKRRN